MEPITRDQIGTYPFTPAEFERLYAFRQAVLAGFYSDELPDAAAKPAPKSSKSSKSSNSSTSDA